MKIYSKFKDYYDYLGKIYGEDPLVNWERSLLTERYDSPVIDDRGYRNLDPYSFVPWWRYENDWSDRYDQRLVLVTGRRFLVYRRSRTEQTRLRLPLGDNPWTALTADSEVLSIIAGNDWRNRQRVLKEDKVRAYLGEYSEEAMNLCIHQGSPILWLSVLRSGIQIHPGSPVLGDIVHFASIYSADQIYQDISDFWLNRAGGSPDRDPPVEVDNATKIVYHGFDKTSFRPGLRL